MFKEHILSVFIVAALTPGVVVGGSPVPFDQWQANNGAISSTGSVISATGVGGCFAGVACGKPLTGPGMFQRSLTFAADGGRYQQSIITDSAASGTAGTLSFSTESFIKEGWASTTTAAGVNAGDGIAVKQILKGTAQGNFDQTTTINTGWAKTADAPSIDIFQRNSGVFAGSQSDSTYRYRANIDSTGKVTGFSQDIDLTAIQSVKYDPRRQNIPTDVFVFARRERAGDMNLGGATSSGKDDGDDKTSLPAGADVQVTWIGQVFEGGGEASTRFGYQSYQNLSSGQPGTFKRDFDGAPGRPWSWNSLFGPIPSIPPGYGRSKDD